MVFLTSRNVVHRDLAVRNLLVNKVDDKYAVKVGDFGLSRNIENEYYKQTQSKIPVRWYLYLYLSISTDCFDRYY